MSYSVSGLVRDFRPAGYPPDAPIVPTACRSSSTPPRCSASRRRPVPERHLEGAELLGADTRGAEVGDAGAVLSERIVDLMRATAIPNGISGVGYGEADIPALTEGALPQQRLLNNAPREIDGAALSGLFRDALAYW